MIGSIVCDCVLEGRGETLSDCVLEGRVDIFVLPVGLVYSKPKRYLFRITTKIEYKRLNGKEHRTFQTDIASLW